MAKTAPAKGKAPTKACPSCGKPNHPRKKVCEHCGKEIPQKESAAKPDKPAGRKPAPAVATSEGRGKIVSALETLVAAHGADEIEKALTYLKG